MTSHQHFDAELIQGVLVVSITRNACYQGVTLFARMTERLHVLHQSKSDLFYPILVISVSAANMYIRTENLWGVRKKRYLLLLESSIMSDDTRGIAVYLIIRSGRKFLPNLVIFLTNSAFFMLGGKCL